MKNNIIIKSFRNGLSLHLCEETPFDELLREIAEKFDESAAFFGDAKMALSFEGRKLTSDEEKAVIKAISAHSDINIVCVVGHDEESNKNFVKALKMLSSGEGGHPDKEATLHHGNLKEGGELDYAGSIIVLGDIHPGARVKAGGSIIVLGGLYGEALAGESGFIFALEMSPQRLAIGEVEYLLVAKNPKWSIKMKLQPKIAKLCDGHVEVEVYRGGM